MSIQALNTEDFRTDDMGIVTFFRINNVSHRGIAWENAVCYWNFELTPQVLSLLGQFTSGKALVEPKAYSREFARTKREFYQSDRKRRQAQADSQG